MANLNQSSRLDPKLVLGIGAAIVLLNGILKGLYLDGNDIAMDEPFTLFWAQQPLSEIWELAKRENNPPLHFVVEHFFIKWFGIGPWAVRMPSLMFSSITAGLMFVVGHRHGGWMAGTVAAVLFSLSTEHMYYSHEARAYPMLCLFTLLSLDAYVRLFGTAPPKTDYAWWGLWSVLLIYTHFLGFWVLLAQGLGMLWMPKLRQRIPALALVMAGVLVAYSPNLYAFALRVQSVKAAGGTWVQAPHWTQIYGHINFFLNGKWTTLALGLCMGAAAFWGFRKQRFMEWLQSLWVERRTLVVLGSFVVVYAGMFVQSLVFSPTFIPRYLLFASVPLYLGIGLLWAALPGRSWLSWACLVAVVLTMMSGFDLNPWNHRDMKGLIAKIESLRKEHVPLIVCPDYTDKALMYHLDLSTFESPASWPEKLIQLGVFPVTKWSDLPDSLRNGKRELLYLDADAKFTLPQNGILDSLQARGDLIQHEHVEQIFDLYLVTPR